MMALVIALSIACALLRPIGTVAFLARNSQLDSDEWGPSERKVPLGYVHPAPGWEEQVVWHRNEPQVYTEVGPTYVPPPLPSREIPSTQDFYDFWSPQWWAEENRLDESLRKMKEENRRWRKARAEQKKIHEQWEREHGVHLNGTFNMIKFASQVFRQQKSGRIVNTASPAGLGAIGHASYASAKEGVAGLTRTVAKDLGRYGITCNAIRPAAGTRMTVHPDLEGNLERMREMRTRPGQFSDPDLEETVQHGRHGVGGAVVDDDFTVGDGGGHHVRARLDSVRHDRVSSWAQLIDPFHRDPRRAGADDLCPHFIEQLG